MPQDTTTTMIDWEELHRELSHPFSDALIQYRIGAIDRDKTKAQALPYVPVNHYIDRLNEIIPGRWHVSYTPWGDNRLICQLTIGDLTRSSIGDGTGSPDAVAGVAMEAQALKRACARFGLGRHLYELQPQWVPYDAASKRLQAMPNQQRSITKPRSADVEVAIGRERASSMHRELVRIGLGRSQHETFASKTLGRPVVALANVTETEARLVWEAATRHRAGNRTNITTSRQQQPTQGVHASAPDVLPRQPRGALGSDAPNP